jgi:MazG family protein
MPEPNDAAPWRERPERSPADRFQRFVDVIFRLRSPGGCPWDREQTHRTLRPTTLEEAYEVLHAIDEDDADGLKDELGDLLLQVVFHADVAMRDSRFDIVDVVDCATDKMIRRHPHVFGAAEAATSAAVLRNWEELKRRERAARGAAPLASILDSVSQKMPALLEASQISEKAARAGFDWKRAEDVFPKVEEELGEVRAAAAEADATATELEIGDLLFAVVNLARKLHVDPESALRRSNAKFRRRFGAVEGALRSRGRTPSESTLDEMEALWTAAKETPPDRP